MHTALALIARRAQFDLLKLLLEEGGVDINGVGTNGMTALHCLCAETPPELLEFPSSHNGRSSAQETISFLVRHGLDIDARFRKDCDLPGRDVVTKGKYRAYLCAPYQGGLYVPLTGVVL
jgi:hypothetical protein